MSKKRILFVTQELNPYLVEKAIGDLVLELAKHTNGKEFEVRLLMPRFGCINERRHKLHEVVRLSGINIIIDDDDYPLIIKVASLPGGARMQVYFLDNDDFFRRKYTFRNADGEMYDDNAERMVFQCKGVLETVKKFGWSPDLIHCHGWMTSLVPLMVKTAYKNDPIFADSKVVYSVYDQDFEGVVESDFEDKALVNRVSEEDLEVFGDASNINLDLGAIHYADAVVKAGAEIPEDIIKALENNLEKPQLTANIEETTSLDCYTDFYRMLLSEEEEIEEIVESEEAKG